VENLSLSIKLDAFEGPLDLLLHLIKKSEINIYDIPIAKITEEYIKTIETMREMNLDVAGEFLVMAATLIYIKSRMLLPVYKSEDEEDLDDPNREDPREELVRLLIEYQKYQDAGKNLGQLELLGRDTFKHPKTASYITDTDRPIKNMEVFQLISAYQKIVNKYLEQDADSHNIDMPTKSLQEKIIELIDKYPEGFLNISLEDILTQPVTKGELVFSFICLLELAKLGYLKIMQANNQGDILLTTIKPLSLFDTNMISKEDLFKEAS
jgi:segregation and condensation protein A